MKRRNGPNSKNVFLNIGESNFFFAKSPSVHAPARDGGRRPLPVGGEAGHGLGPGALHHHGDRLPQPGRELRGQRQLQMQADQGEVCYTLACFANISWRDRTTGRRAGGEDAPIG